MKTYRTPGVYFEPAEPPRRTVQEVRTDIAGFVGVAERGPLHTPVRVENPEQFRTRFGGPVAYGFLAYAVEGFFANGGDVCWVVRVGDPGAGRASQTLLTGDGLPTLRVTARDPGPAGEAVTLTVERPRPPGGPDGRFDLRVRYAGDEVEAWRDLSMDRHDARYVEKVLGANPAGPARQSVPPFIEVEDLHAPPRATPPARSAAPAPVRNVRLGDWQDLARRVAAARPGSGSGYQGWLSSLVSKGSPALNGPTDLRWFTGDSQHPDWGLATLEAVDEIGLLAMPDLVWRAPVDTRRLPPRRCCDPAQGQPRPHLLVREERTAFGDDEILRGQAALLGQCEKLRDRFAVVDPPFGQDPTQAGGRFKRMVSQYAAFYYPAVYVADPLGLDGPVRLVPPSGHVCGMIARLDRGVGVHKPPANEELVGVQGVEVEVDAETHGLLNDDNVNVIRPVPGRDIRVLGARTLASPDDPEWRFINVRRLLLMIEKSIGDALPWTVFEPNDPLFEREVGNAVRNFLDGLWRRGLLDGGAADDAFGVVCDPSTNPPDGRDRGELVCLIRVRPPQPAEFVTVRVNIGGVAPAGRGGVNG